jgi:ubiquinone/menaquinone biosynthesis C-methylase UbiE
MKCNFCGYDFDEKENIPVCQNCPLAKSCKLIRCPNCGYEWPAEPEWLKKLNKEMNSISSESKTELNQKYWDFLAEKYDRIFSFLGIFQKKVIKLINPQNNISFLDIGCGTGWAVRYAASLVEEGKFYGIDLSSKMIEIAKRKAAGLKNIQFYKTIAENLPFESDLFDVGICTYSFHHHANPAATLKEAHRVLKPKGRLYIVDGTTDGILTRLIDKIARKIEKTHVKMYSTKEYETLFSQAGFKYIMSEKMWGPVKVHVGEKP